MNRRIIFISMFVVMLLSLSTAFAQNYAGTQYCQVCHSNSAIGGMQYTYWSQSLHSKIHLAPNDSSIRPLSAFVNGQSIGMGAGYNNAQVILSKVGTEFKAQVGTGGETYTIRYTTVMALNSAI